LLAEQGVSTILVERQSVAGKAFRGEILNAEGEQVIQKQASSFPTLFKSLLNRSYSCWRGFPDLEHSVHDHIRSWKDFVPLDIFSSRSDT
jgi:hypothetical protein